MIKKRLNYDYLFGHSPERIALLNQCGGALFYIIDYLFIDDFITSLSRLTDKADGKRNFSLGHLLVVLDGVLHAALIATLSAKLDSLGARVSNIRKHRNKRVSHADYRTSVSPTDVLPPVSRELIEGTLVAAEEFLYAFDHHFSGVETIGTLPLENGADILYT